MIALPFDVFHVILLNKTCTCLSFQDKASSESPAEGSLPAPKSESHLRVASAFALKGKLVKDLQESRQGSTTSLRFYYFPLREPTVKLRGALKSNQVTKTIVAVVVVKVKLTAVVMVIIS